LLLFNLATDVDDPILGFTTDWIREFALHAARIDVVTMRRGRLAVPANVRVYSLGKERGYSEARRGLRFYRILGRLLMSTRYDGAFAHMATVFAVMAAPLLRSRRIPLTLWYAHTATPWTLRLAERAADRIVTASVGSFPIPSRKLIVTGHGVNTARFEPGRVSREELVTLAIVGRIHPDKGLEVLFEAVQALVEQYGMHDLNVRVIGPVYEQGDSSYQSTLCEQARRLGIEHRIVWAGVIHPTRMAAEYHRVDLVINVSLGALDKSVLEAMSCGVPVITSNAATLDLVRSVDEQLVVPQRDPQALAAACHYVRRLRREERESLGRRLRAAVVEQHSLERLAAQLADDLLLRPRVVIGG
jgi:glycosyltransferase involved in cell wall biosynthesis